MEESEAAFTPTYDADGNATLIQTSTRTWAITYNGENRPIRFENAATQAVIECAYDSQGRRFEKKVTVAGVATLHHRYIYRGYFQIAALDLTRSAHPALWFVTWDPTQSTATSPLAIQKDGTWYTYGYDITKNICEVFGSAGYIRTSYSYAPFGAVSESGDVTQPFQWSSEHYDSELGLVYYNFRHYSPDLGRFLSRDPISEQGGLNLYAFAENSPTIKSDRLGQNVWIENTTAASGWHRRVCVDTWARSYVVTNLWGIKFCCHESIKYVKTSKFCISFGDKNRDINYSSGDSGGEDTPSRTLYRPPPGFEHVPGGSGVVYPDNDDPATSSHVSSTLQCDKDIRALDYMRSLIGMEGEYTVLWNNCRDFSEVLFEYLSSEEF